MAHKSPLPRWATKREVQDYLSCSLMTVNRLIADGEVVAVRLRSNIRIDLNSVDAALAPISSGADQ